MGHRLPRTALAMLGAAFFLAGEPAHGQASEEAIKAAFLPKFARYIELPAAAGPAAGQPYYLCVIGSDPFGDLIDRAAASETIGGHGIAVRRFANTEPGAVAGCHIAYVAGASDGTTATMLQTLRRQATLTITDARIGRARGMIHFVVADGRVRFHIDDAAAAERGIAISSRLLALAVKVRQRR